MTLEFDSWWQGERPEASPTESEWASDVIASLLRELELEFVALNPGSSYRGLHDSLVNHLGNVAPELLLCLHEEHAVAIAHGYAKAVDRPMAVALHSNVGLMHASMAIFNAFCDRVPMLVLGGTGPLDAARRRPWIDWLHTAVDQAALIRPFVKWDDQPLSLEASLDAVLQGHMLTRSSPKAPTYVCLDAAVLETPLEGPAEPAPALRFAPAVAPQPPEDTVARIAAQLVNAERPVLLVGRVSRSAAAWDARVELAERLDARVFTHLKLPAAFPTRHPLLAAPASTFVSPALRDALVDADVILALDWLDLGGTFAAAGEIPGTTISASLESQLHSGWGKDSFTPVPADVRLDADVDATVTALLRHVPPRSLRRSAAAQGPRARQIEPDRARGELIVDDIAVALDRATWPSPVTLVRVPNSWSGALWHVDHPLDMLGADGGEGIGSGPGMAVGAALALRDGDRLVVAVLGDGDFLMGVSALWTAAHYRVPVLIIVANNRSFFNDEIHQHHVAVQRGRPTQNRWIGQRIADPEADLVSLAAAQGLIAHGPIETHDALEDALTVAVDQVRGGRAVVVDVRISSSVEGDVARAATQGGRG